VPAKKIPSPADVPQFTATQLIERIQEQGGHVMRMRELLVFVITENGDLADWLIKLGGAPYLPRNMVFDGSMPLGGYRDSRGGVLKWDIYVHHIPVLGEETVWEAAGRHKADLYEVE
jgi:hypothetical protein